MVQRRVSKINRWLFAIAIAIFSALLVAYAYDIDQGIPISLASTNAANQKILMSVAGALGFRGSIILGVLATGAGIYNAIRNSRT